MRVPRALAVGVLLVTTSGCAWMARASVGDGPAGVAGTASSRNPSLSQGGRFVAFESDAANLVPGDTNATTDVFVRDVVAGQTWRVSVATGGAQGNGASRRPSISDDGRFVAFETDAANLLPGDTDDDTDVALHDRVTGATTLVSTGVVVAPPVDGSDFDARAPEISGDGGSVAFLISAAFSSGCCAPLGPFVRDLAAGTTALMPSIGGGLAWDLGLSLSDDGSRILYGQFGPPDQVGDAAFGVAVVDVATGTTVAPVAGGTLRHVDQPSFDMALSGDGGTVAFAFASQSAGTLSTLDVDAPGGGLVEVLTGLVSPTDPSISDDGSAIVLLAGGSYVATDPSGATPVVVSADPLGTPADQVARGGDVTGDGRFVAFASNDPDLLPGGPAGVSSVYVRSRVGSAPPT